MITAHLNYFFIKAGTFPFSFLSYKTTHRIGRVLGSLLYYTCKSFRKKTLANLALAKDLSLTFEETPPLAKKSLQNLLITCLDYPKLAKETDIQNIAFCDNPEPATKILEKGKGVIFFCGHQANWEVLFLEGTSRMSGVAIGRPIKNKILYDWILSIREKWGGKIIPPKQAIKEGLRALKQGKFLGIVGDQGMPDSGYSSPFLGRKAWTSPIAALLSYRSNCPIFVATTVRENDKYRIHYSDPIWPDQTKPLEEEIPRLMNYCLSKLEESIKRTPDQWLWQHNRWKQQVPGVIKKAFRFESIAILFPSDIEETSALLASLPTFRKIYPHEFITVFLPTSFADTPIDESFEKVVYAQEKDLFIKDYRFKLVFNFTSSDALKKHFLGLSSFKVYSLENLFHLAPDLPRNNLSAILFEVISHAS